MDTISKIELIQKAMKEGNLKDCIYYEWFYNNIDDLLNYMEKDIYRSVDFIECL